MIRHFLLGTLLHCTIFLGLVSCKGASPAEENKKENLNMTNEVIQVQPDSLAEEAFRQAAHDGDTEKVKAFLKQGVQCNVTDQDGHTALMFAAFNGHSEIVLSLLEAGAAIDQRDYLDRTALLYGSTGPFPETVKILLDNGADPNKVDSEEHFSPLMHAAAEGHLEVVKVLIQYGADKFLKDEDGDDAATFAAQSGHMQVVEFLKLAE
jgi:ankyrin repeat protein